MDELFEANDWNEHLLKNAPKSGAFLQSWEWGNFQTKMGHIVHRFKNEYLQTFEHTLPFGKKYWFLPRATPTTEIETNARANAVTFLRFEPFTKTNIPINARKTISISPSATLITTINRTDEELISSMHEKTRYNIRLGLRKGVTVEQYTGNHPLFKNAFDSFWRLMEETGTRDGFRIHPCAYYEAMLLEIPTNALCIARHNDSPIAAGIWNTFGDTITYLHGASTAAARSVMAPYVLHWNVMKNARDRGILFYDFWGIDADLAKSHDYEKSNLGGWAGITRFKMGFGGEILEFPGTFDLTFSPGWYMLYKVMRSLRRSLS